MFTGLVSNIGEVGSTPVAADGGRLFIRTDVVAAMGDSIAVDGACLTVAACDPDGVAFDVMPATLAVTTLGGLDAGDRVNLEPALRAGDALGGHMVQGHVDGVADVTAVTEDGNAVLVDVALPGDLAAYTVERGSICLAGVSLTVMGRSPGPNAGTCRVSLIPETRERTTLGRLSVGDRLNVEVDILARYVDAAVRRRLPDA